MRQIPEMPEWFCMGDRSEEADRIWGIYYEIDRESEIYSFREHIMNVLNEDME